MNSIWSASVYVIIVVLGLLSLLISYNFLIETKGVDLGEVNIHKELNSISIKNNDEALMETLVLEELKK